MEYYAFISFSSKDSQWGKWLQRKLEAFRLPTSLCKRGLNRNPIKPVFFAPSDIQPGGLTREIQKRLQNSKHLIVICSPDSAKSRWVGQEISFFYEMVADIERIHLFIVRGYPHSEDKETECFHPVIDALGIPEILGANVNEHYSYFPWLNRERAYIQLVSKLLGVEFDVLWNRNKRRTHQRVFSIVIIALLFCFAAWTSWKAFQPFTTIIQVVEPAINNKNLPRIQETILTFSYDGKTLRDTIKHFDEDVVIRNIPRRYLNKEVHISILGKGLLSIDSTMILTKKHIIRLRRNPHLYGDIFFKVWDPKQERSIPNIPLTIEEEHVITNENGEVSLFIPLEQQREAYHVFSNGFLLDTLVYPSAGKGYILLVK